MHFTNSAFRRCGFGIPGFGIPVPHSAFRCSAFRPVPSRTQQATGRAKQPNQNILRLTNTKMSMIVCSVSQNSLLQQTFLVVGCQLVQALGTSLKFAYHFTFRPHAPPSPFVHGAVGGRPCAPNRESAQGAQGRRGREARTPTPPPLHCFCPPGAENPSYATASGHALSAARTGRMYRRTDTKTRAFHASSGLLTSSSVDAEALSWTTCTVPPPSSVSTAQAVVLSDHTQTKTRRRN